MLRGFSTISFFADDFEAAKAWYTELLGAGPYFEVPGYMEFRVGEYQHEIGIAQGEWAPHDMSAAPGGAIAYWQVDDLDAAIARLTALGAKEYEPKIVRGEGFETASFVDPFGNLLAVMYNQHYLDILASFGKGA
ncbi:VOC family protein [Glycomyces algeriensis]|uniref:Glyoxalase n=1 Tax=Glycomyces algeriensis TaxID=256037 RepID=A0A9W6GAI5_9ACTN|nr:VOC family protein [Glycomyces algeriensis]MDA1364740.1 VOC family protein [Glycomyces algeriensis]MDR7350781.1 putative enzyme related to lactoylglutathione lyase [Glycomyces algeriensis]GLI43491.1 glyoxalase [Glycomyces algeriensis]